jgi:hypothetical protein
VNEETIRIRFSHLIIAGLCCVCQKTENKAAIPFLLTNILEIIISVNGVSMISEILILFAFFMA